MLQPSTAPRLGIQVFLKESGQVGSYRRHEGDVAEQTRDWTLWESRSPSPSSSPTPALIAMPSEKRSRKC